MPPNFFLDSVANLEPHLKVWDFAAESQLKAALVDVLSSSMSQVQEKCGLGKFSLGGNIMTMDANALTPDAMKSGQFRFNGVHTEDLLKTLDQSLLHIFKGLSGPTTDEEILDSLVQVK